MRALLRPGRDKSALSNIVAYVLLIAITVSLSVIVYGWLRFYVSGDEVETCSDGVNIIIRSYECYDESRLTITLKNKGLFTVDGYVLRVHDREDAKFGIYTFDEDGVVIDPGDEHEQTYLFNESLQDGYELSTVTLVEVQPFMTEDGEIRCQSYSSQEVECAAE